jgi:catechol 2,3-dioxygenase-like lactoylglutathione lyase family enzyme
MSAQLNHTIVWCRDQEKSAGFLAQLLGLPPPRRFMHFLVVDLANGVSLDYYQSQEHVALQHYAFLVSEDEFDAIYGRLRAQGLEVWADPARTQPGQINHHFGGRGVYFQDPDGHLLEIITQPYSTVASTVAGAA